MHHIERAERWDAWERSCARSELGEAGAIGEMVPSPVYSLGCAHAGSWAHLSCGPHQLTCTVGVCEAFFHNLRCVHMGCMFYKYVGDDAYIYL